MRTRPPAILCYHAVSSEWPHALSVAPAELEHQLRAFLARRFRAVGAREAVARRGRLLHVTFDDAFRSVWDAIPILERLRLAVTVFVCPGFADRGGAPLDVPELAGEVRAYPHVLATMTWDAVRALADRGVEIGSHTSSHPHLPRLGAAELRAELADSRARIEDELRRPCTLLAYPFGDENQRVRVAARAAGYEIAFGLPGDWRDCDQFAFPRIGAYRGDNALKLRLKGMPTAHAAAAVRRR